MRNHFIWRGSIRARALAATGLAGAALLVGALAEPGAAVAAPPAHGTALIRGAHLSPDTPGVDVYLKSFSGGKPKLWLSDVGYGDFSSYRRVPAGVYAVSMRAHGAKPSTPAALSWTLDAKAGQAYTVAAVGLNKNIHGVVLHDDLAMAPHGQGRVRVIQASNRATTADVVASPDHVIANNTRFATATHYTSIPAGRTTIKATGGDKATAKSVDIPAGGVESVVLLDSAHGGLQVRTVLDASGDRLTPSGPVNAGGGGTALTASTDERPGALAWLVGALALAGVGLVAGRRRLVALVRPGR